MHKFIKLTDNISFAYDTIANTKYNKKFDIVIRVPTSTQSACFSDVDVIAKEVTEVLGILNNMGITATLTRRLYTTDKRSKTGHMTYNTNIEVSKLYKIFKFIFNKEEMICQKN